jgi:hypothetical protein
VQRFTSLTLFFPNSLRGLTTVSPRFVASIAAAYRCNVPPKI